MRNIIKIKGNDCFIDTEGLSELANNEHRAVIKLINTYRKDIEEFGVLTPVVSKPDKKGGRPKTTYELNEQQATLLTTFMKKSDKVTNFKKELVREFFKMRQFIQKQEAIRLAGIEARKELTDVVKDSNENERMHGHAYSNYTNMVYEICGLKSNYKQFKSDQKIVDGYDKLNFRDTLSTDDLKRVKLAESFVKSMIELGKGYSEIKETIKPLFDIKELK